MNHPTIPPVSFAEQRAAGGAFSEGTAYPYKGLSAQETVDARFKRLRDEVPAGLEARR